MNGPSETISLIFTLIFMLHLSDPLDHNLETRKYVKVGRTKLKISKSVILLQNIVIHIFYSLLVVHVDEKSFFNIS